MHLRCMQPTLPAVPSQRQTSATLDCQHGSWKARRLMLHAVVQERHAHRLRIPRRPAWDRGTSPEELDARERAAFLAWRRDLAQCAPHHSSVVRVVTHPSTCCHIGSLSGIIIAVHGCFQAGGGREAGVDAIREEHRGLAAALASP